MLSMRRLLALVLAGLSPLACTVHLDVPPDAVITCVDDSNCPGGLVCHNQRCVKAAGIDSTPPDLSASATVTPPSGKAGATLVIAFATTKPLAEAPTVLLALDAPVTVTCSGQAQQYRCEYLITGLENGGRGGVAPFDIKLVDLAANVNVKHQAGAIGIDLSPPVLASASVSPASSRLGARLEVFLTASEALQGPVVLTATPGLGDGDGGTVTELSLDADPGTLNYRFAHVVAPQDPTGAVRFSARLTDLAGNVSPALSVGQTVIDPVAPVVSNLQVAPARINAHGDLVVSFDVSKLVADLQVSVGGRSLSCQPVVATSPNYTCTRPMQGDELPAGTTGAQVVFVLVTDAAGNQGSASSSVVFDFQDPAVSSAAVSYLPTGTNPLNRATAATAGTTIFVSVVADEALDTAVVPTLTASNGTSTLEFGAALAVTETSVTFSVVVDGGVTDGTYAPSLQWSDVAHNQASQVHFSTPAIRVKTAPPVLIVDQAQVSFLRSPWGSSVGENLGAFTLPAGPYFALAPSEPLANVATLAAGTFTMSNGALQRVRIWDSPVGGSLLGVLIPARDAAGAITSWPRQAFTQTEAPVVYLSGLDEAGNESPLVKVQTSEWVATANPPPFGANPHQVQLISSVTATRDPLPSVTSSLANPALVSGTDGAAVLAQAEATWRQRGLGGGGLPPARLSPAMAYDSARGRVVLFGGEGVANQQDTWEWDGATWTERTPLANNPPARHNHAMVYDSARGRTVLFGGQLPDNTGLQDLWEWDGVSWLERTPASGPLPPARGLPAMAYDSARARVIVFGGNSYGNDVQDLWEWDGAAWLDKTPAGTKPSARTRHAMAYDSLRGQTVMFGGLVVGTPSQETWEWNGTVWVDRTSASTPPAARRNATMAFDSVRGKTLVFGGATASADLNDLWEWDGATWTNPIPTGAMPAPQGYDALVFDSAHGVALMFGGSPSGSRQDLWSWDGVAWRNVTPAATSPGPRTQTAMVYDSSRQVVWLFGGFDGTAFHNDLWQWDGQRWTDKTPAGTKPSARYLHGMAYNEKLHTVLMFGGNDGANRQDLWQWDGVAWTDLTPAGTKPSARYALAMAYDAVRQVTVVFSGFARQDIWEWDDTTWVDKTPAGTQPSGRSFSSLVYDVSHAQMVMFGGYAGGGTSMQETWVWDGAQWTNKTAGSTPPSPRYGQAMAYDSARSRVVLFGGFASAPEQDSWEWDGASWTNKTPVHVKPPGRTSSSMVYDSARGRMVLFGGGIFFQSGNSYANDTWEWDSPPTRRPAVQVNLAAAAAALPSGSSVTGLRVRAACGGVFFPYGVTGVGATLLGWANGGPALSSGAWVSLASNAVGLNAALIDWQATSPAEAQRYATSADQRLAFQCRPAGGSGVSTQEASVALDSFETRLRYVSP